MFGGQSLPEKRGAGEGIPIQFLKAPKATEIRGSWFVRSALCYRLVHSSMHNPDARSVRDSLGGFRSAWWRAARPLVAVGPRKRTSVQVSSPMLITDQSV